MTQKIKTCVLVLLFFPCILWAADDGVVVNSRQALLWKIEGERIQSSYLFGTMHSDDPRIIALLEVIKPMIEEAQLVCTEIKFNFQTLDKANEVMYFEDGQSLKTVVGNRLFKQSSQALALQGYSSDMVDQLKPWAVTVLLSQPDTGMAFLDAVIYNEGLQLEKKLCGLENISEQIQTFAGMAVEDQVAILKETLEMVPSIPLMNQELIEVYLQRDLAKIIALNDKYSLKDKALMQKFMTRLVYERNTRMAKRMLVKMQQQNAFFAVGALHLPGKQGILSILEAKGLKISPIY